MVKRDPNNNRTEPLRDYRPFFLTHEKKKYFVVNKFLTKVRPIAFATEQNVLVIKSQVRLVTRSFYSLKEWFVAVVLYQVPGQGIDCFIVWLH